MEQTLPLSEMSTIPTRKLRVMRWVTFVLVLIGSLWSEFIYYSIIEYIRLAEILGLSEKITFFATIFVDIVFWLFLIYLSSNRAVRNAMIIMVAADCLLVSVPFFSGWISSIFMIIKCLLNVYAYSIVIMNTNLSSIKKGWITVLCLAGISCIVSVVTILHDSLAMLGYYHYSSFSSFSDIFGFLCFDEPMYKVHSCGYTLFSVIAWYQLFFSDAFAYTGFKKDDDGVIYRYPFFNRYTVGMFISSAFVISLMCLLIAKVFTL